MGAGWSDAALAEGFGVSVPTVSLWRRGVASCSAPGMLLLAAGELKKRDPRHLRLRSGQQNRRRPKPRDASCAVVRRYRQPDCRFVIGMIKSEIDPDGVSYACARPVPSRPTANGGDSPGRASATVTQATRTTPGGSDNSQSSICYSSSQSRTKECKHRSATEFERADIAGSRCQASR